MIIKLNFENFQRMNNSIDAVGSEMGVKHPLLYHEDDSFIHLYRPIEYVVYSTEISKSQVSDLIAFKLEFIPKSALEIMEPMYEKNQVVLRVENG